MISYHQAMHGEQREALTRRRLLAIAAAGAAPFALGIPIAKAGVGSRIDSPLQVFPNGGVKVTGTIGPWDADYVSAVFVAQIEQDGNVAAGRSGRYYPGATTFALGAWDADYGRLHPGAAIGHGTQHTLLRNGKTETYHWTVPIRLVDHAV